MHIVLNAFLSVLPVGRVFLADARSFHQVLLDLTIGWILLCFDDVTEICFGHRCCFIQRGKLWMTSLLTELGGALEAVRGKEGSEDEVSLPRHSLEFSRLLELVCRSLNRSRQSGGLGTPHMLRLLWPPLRWLGLFYGGIQGVIRGCGRKLSFMPRRVTFLIFCGRHLLGVHGLIFHHARLLRSRLHFMLLWIYRFEPRFLWKLKRHVLLNDCLSALILWFLLDESRWVFTCDAPLLRQHCLCELISLDVLRLVLAIFKWFHLITFCIGVLYEETLWARHLRPSTISLVVMPDDIDII